MARLIEASANNTLDVLLEELCFELGLTRTQRERAARAYVTVGNWVSAEDGPLAVWRPRVFPQGSIPLGTAVRPRETDEFDADGVCLFRGGRGLSASEAYELVYSRIAEHETYRHRIQREPRCIRLEYEGSMHLDIIPAIPGIQGILIPTADRTGWQSTDPEGYQRWFENVGRPTTLGMDKRADAEPMPPFQEAHARPPLTRIVQLTKRRRDVAIVDVDLRPKSILATTLVGKNWDGQPLASDGILGVLARLKSLFPIGSSPSIVPNPVNNQENLARHWLENRAAYDQFTTFVSDFHGRINYLLGLKGTEEIAAALEDLFDPRGTGIIKNAVSNYTARFQKDREGSLIRAVGSGVAATSRAIPRNQFYGR